MTPPPVFFGAFDRHNLGDILLAHLQSAGVDNAVFAGLAARDLTPYSGQRVVPLDAIDEPMNLIHVGGELLDCDATQAAFMLGEPAPRWSRRAPYVVPRNALPAGSRVEFRAVGGVDLARREPAFIAEVLAALRQASLVSVRDRVTQAFLATAGVSAELEADPVTRLAEVFGERILSRVHDTAPYVAVQFAAECGDDRSVAAFAQGLDRIGLPVALFRAGAAPWHDALEPYRRLAAHLAVPVRLFESLDAWEICVLIAASRGYLGTSLHGRLVAEAFRLPVLSLEREPGSATKLRAYLDTWQPGQAIHAPDDFAESAREFQPAA